MSSSVVSGNSTPVSSCMYSTDWSQKSHEQWIEADEEETQFYSPYTQITLPQDNNGIKDETSTKAFREKKRKSRGYKHVPHREKPAQVVAKRNARERRRVQAVNSAFGKLRKAIPFEHAR